MDIEECLERKVGRENKVLRTVRNVYERRWKARQERRMSGREDACI